MELTGKIIAVLPANSGVSSRTGNPWMSQEYVIEVPGQYPRKCVFRIFGEDRIKQFNIQNGEEVTVSFDIDAHEYNGRWFNEIRAYNVTRGAAPVAAAPRLRSLQHRLLLRMPPHRSLLHRNRQARVVLMTFPFRITF